MSHLGVNLTHFELKSDHPAVFPQIQSLILPTSDHCAPASDLCDPVSDPQVYASWLSEWSAGALDMKRQSVLSFLCLAFGFIATLDSEDALKQNHSGNVFFIDAFLTALIQHGTK